MSDSKSQQREEVEKDTSQELTKTSSPVENKAIDDQNSIDNNPPKSPDFSNRKIKLNSLTPSVYNEYNEILKNVFAGDEHKNDHNIAITADYGEGKSSVINSFLKQNQEIKEKTITVSLSKYNYKNKNDDTKKHSYKCKDNDLDGCDGDYSICEHLHSVENRIEVQIINQILYQIDSKNIYLSKYKIKENLPDGWRWFFGVLAAILIFSIYNLIFSLSENIKEWSNWTDKWGLWLGWLVVIIPLSIFGFFFVFHQQWQRISNIVFNVFGSKIETNYFKNNAFNLSIWDQEWREIIYIIRYSKKNYIIFEDLDRLENYEILSKLKDLLLTLNINIKKDEDKIKFIYVMSDHIFKEEKDKTKFFDLIIPIIPLSSLDSRILIWYSSLDPKISPDEELIKKVSNHIFDIRLIKHIANEYNVFANLKSSSESKNSNVSNLLFCLIVLKNTFIDEFKIFKYQNFYDRNFDISQLMENNKHQDNSLFDELIKSIDNWIEEADFSEIIYRDIIYFLKDCYDNELIIKKILDHLLGKDNLEFLNKLLKWMNEILKQYYNQNDLYLDIIKTFEAASKAKIMKLEGVKTE